MRIRYLASLGAAMLVVASMVWAGSARASGNFPGRITFDQPNDPFTWAFPEGIAVDKTGNVFISVAAPSPGVDPANEDWNDQIWKFSPSGEKTIFADFYEYDKPQHIAGKCGLAVDPEGNVYMARLKPAGYTGVFRVDKAGGVPVLLPGTDQIQSPDGLAFDQRGSLFVTELFTKINGGYGQGSIWRIPKRGSAELWLRHDLLTGSPNGFLGYPAGANGIAFYHNALYVANTDLLTVVRIPVRPDGSPGEPEVWATVGDVPESPLYGWPVPPMIDGLTMDALGNVYLVVATRASVVRINARDRSQETVAYFPKDPLDLSYSLAFGTGKGERQSLFVTSDSVFKNMLGPAWPGAGITKVDVGVPGLPLP